MPPPVQLPQSRTVRIIPNDEDSSADEHELPQIRLHESKKNTILTSHGRPPWYSEDGKVISDAFVIAVAGGSASGKTHVARQIVKTLGSIPTVVIMSQDSFYKEHTPAELELAFANQYDFDHPHAVDMQMFAACLSDLKACRQTNLPVYSFSEHQRLPEKRYLYGAAIIIVEGIMTLQDPGLRSQYDLKVFVQCDSDLMLARRIRRDVKERGRSVDGVIDQYLRFVKPAFDNFVAPTAKYADVIVPGADNHVAIELICTHIRRQLKDRTSKRFREKLSCMDASVGRLSRTPSSSSTLSDVVLASVLDITVLEETAQLQGIYTILRDKTTDRQEFIFFLDRLSVLVVERALQFLPVRQKEVTTPTDTTIMGQEIDAQYVCGVTILRSGGPLEQALRKTIHAIPIGSLLVQSEGKNGEPLLLHTMLPLCIRERHKAEEAYVFLMDAQIGTAAAAFMAVRVLLDHGIRQDHIIFITFLVARKGGITRLQRAFPLIRIVCGAIDDTLQEEWLTDVSDNRDGNEGEQQQDERRKVWIIQPGMGQIGDRYYLR